MLCCYSYPFCFQVSNRSFHFFSRVAIASGIFFVDLSFFFWPLHSVMGLVPCRVFFLILAFRDTIRNFFLFDLRKWRRETNKRGRRGRERGAAKESSRRLLLLAAYI